MMPGGKPPHAKWGYEVPWGLGFELDGNTSIGSRNSPRVFGHTGGSNAVAFADPETGLTCAIVTNGFRSQAVNAERLSRVADLVNDALAAAY
jgi:CubicO group peptidase (beta-lactamase class C family)